MSEKKLNGMIVLPVDQNVSLKCTDVTAFSFVDDNAKSVSGVKYKFVPDDVSFGEVAFTVMDDNDKIGLKAKIEKGGFYRLGLDINSKAKVTIVDIFRVK